MQSKFTIGDVVHLKSGSPDMTISKVYDNEYVRTVWFSGNDVMQDEFHQDTLVKVEDED